MNETLKAIVDLLDEGNPELKVAASQVLGELSPPGTEVVAALSRHLSSEDHTLNRYLLEALAKIGSTGAIKALVASMRDGGATADLVRHLLSGMGSKVADVLSTSYEDEPRELQAQVLQILGHYSAPGALKVLRQATMGRDEELAATACSLLLERASEVGEPERKLLRDGVFAKIKSGKDLTPGGVANGLTVMAAINVTQARPTLLKYAQPDQHPTVRKAALEGLREAHLTPAQSDTLLAYLDDVDIVNVVKPTLTALGGTSEWSKPGIKTLRGLLSSRREEMKLFALAALQEIPGEEVAKVYMSHLYSPKSDVQAVAMAALSKNPKADPVMLKSLQIERNPEKARVLIKPLMEHADRVKPPQIKTMSEKCGRLLADASELGEPHLELLLAIAPEGATQELVDKATRLRRAHKLTESLRILMHLAGAGTLDLEGRYQLALARLIKDNDEGRSGVISSSGDPTMGFVAGLVRDGFPALDRLKKESMLSAEDLLRVGRHFNSSIGPERRFGTEMLLYVAKKHAKAKAGEEARMMIRSEGL